MNARFKPFAPFQVTRTPRTTIMNQSTLYIAGHSELTSQGPSYNQRKAEMKSEVKVRNCMQVYNAVTSVVLRFHTTSTSWSKLMTRSYTYTTAITTEGKSLNSGC